MRPSCNIASHLPALAEERPYKRAVVMPSGRDAQGRVTWSQLTFLQLDQLSNRYAVGLEKIGITRGMRTVLMVTPSLEFFGLVFALFKVGATLVLIDPGLDRRALLQCFAEVAPEAFIGIPLAHVARTLFPKSFKTVRICVTVGRRYLWGGHTLEEVGALAGPADRPVPYVLAETQPDELAAILFTSGSTGIPKGALYTHGIFDAQVRLLKKTYQFAEDEIDLATFPLFALFDPALGMTAIIPDMDARKPGSADPRKLLEAIEDHGVTSMFGSPALLDRFSQYCSEHHIRLPSVRRVISAGAPVTQSILGRMAGLLNPPAQVFTPYGATEALPACNIGSQEILAETAARTAKGEGICVGLPAPEMTIRIIRISDDPIPVWSEALVVPTGTIGEITARGPVVTGGYYAREAQTRLAKIQEGPHTVHRMGDVGWQDAEGRIWMCGRKSHRVETPQTTHFSVPVEEIFNGHPGVKRAALVWIGERPNQRPLVCIERRPGHSSTDAQLLDALRAVASSSPITAGIRHIVVYPAAFPVDIRHNAKIAREKLAAWAATLTLNA